MPSQLLNSTTQNTQARSSIGQTRPGSRPLWQLFLAAQTGQPLTSKERQALLEFLSQLASEGCDPNIIARRMQHYLNQA